MSVGHLVVGGGSGSIFYDAMGADLSEAEKAAYQGTMEEWNEVVALLPSPVRKKAKRVVDLCERVGAFYTDPPCAIDLVGDDCVMFDWNNGDKPIVSVMVTHPGHRIVCVAKLREKTVTSKDPEFKLEDVLWKLVREIKEKSRPTTSVLQGLCLSEASAKTIFHVEHHSIRQAEVRIVYPSIQQPTPPARTSRKRANTLQVSEERMPFTVGPASSVELTLNTA